MEFEILNISPIDGRYKKLTDEISNYFSEYHLMKNRVLVEIEWLKKLIGLKELGLQENKEEISILNGIVTGFSSEEGIKVKKIEEITKHDVKAVEYYIDEKLKENNLQKFQPLVHFACTSEDINNIAYGIMEKNLKEKIYIPSIKKLCCVLDEKSKNYAAIPMLSHTHGQNATPTTVGKEFAIFVHRLRQNCGKVKTR